MRAMLSFIVLVAGFCAIFGAVSDARAAGEIDTRVLETERRARTDMQRDFVARLNRSVRQVGDPDQVVPSSQVSALTQGWNSMLSLVKSPMSMAGSFGNGLMKGMSQLVGQFGPGGLTAPAGFGVSSNDEPQGTSPRAAASDGQRRPAKFLANPIVSASPIGSGAGGPVCTPGGLLSTCNDADFQPRERDAPSSAARGQVQEYRCSGTSDGNGGGYLCN
jgi:hypothetical protein